MRDVGISSASSKACIFSISFFSTAKDNEVCGNLCLRLALAEKHCTKLNDLTCATKNAWKRFSVVVLICHLPIILFVADTTYHLNLL
jgi:hypothetical protein